MRRTIYLRNGFQYYKAQSLRNEFHFHPQRLQESAFSEIFFNWFLTICSPNFRRISMEFHLKIQIYSLFEPKIRAHLCMSAPRSSIARENPR